MDRRAAAVLTAHGYDASRHRAEQYDARWLERCDLVLAMDHDNLADIAALGPDEHRDRLTLFRDFDPRAHDGDREVPDPYYGGDDGFDAVLAMVERTSDVLVGLLAEAVSTARPAVAADRRPGGGLTWPGWGPSPSVPRSSSARRWWRPARSPAATSARPPGCGSPTAPRRW